MLHESREPYPCHTFRNDAADFLTPSCNFEATHAQRCNSCRSGACPNVQIHYPCRLRRRQEPFKNPAIITIRPRIGLVRLAKRHASQPHAAAPAGLNLTISTIESPSEPHRIPRRRCIRAHEGTTTGADFALAPAALLRGVELHGAKWNAAVRMVRRHGRPAAI